MKNRYLWLTAGTALAFGLMAVSYLCLTISAASLTGGKAEISVSPTQQAQVSLTEEDNSIVQTIDGEICVIKGDTILHTGFSASLLPTQDQEALVEGIPVDDEEALAALLEDLGS